MVLSANKKRVFVCELKDFENVESLEENGWEIVHHPDGSIEAHRNSNAISRIKNAITKAHKQLIKYSEPKIVVFLNHDYRLDVKDFNETFKGYSILGEVNGIRYINVIAQKASDGEIKELKWEIDLYIWIDAIPHSVTGRIEKFHFRIITKQGRELFRKFFTKTNQYKTVTEDFPL